MSEDYSAQQQPTLKWNTARGVWEKVGMANLLCEHWELFSETWQTSGMMRNGQVFELPMQAHRTTDSGYSSLPTPTAVDGNTVAKSELDANDPKHRLKVAVQVLARDSLMPTPTTRDHKDGTEPHERDGVVQTDTVARAVFNSGEVQLPTPTASDWKGANHSGSGSASSRGMATVVEQTNWGKFEPAIRRWEEVLGRPAPAPTKPDGKDGAHRLSSAFTEWMMGVPEGWITDCGLSRNDELKACGNGVVPQQAELALRMLLEGIKLDEDRPR